MDDLFGNLERLDFLKIDTEGNELNVLHGSKNIIQKHLPHICFEVSLTFWSYFEKSVESLFGFLEDLDYELFVLNAGRLQKYIWLNERIMNMFAVHESKIDELRNRGVINN